MSTKTLTPSVKSLLEQVGIEDHDELLIKIKGETVEGSLRWQLWSAFNDLQDSERFYTQALDRIEEYIKGEKTRLAGAYRVDPVWIIQSAKELELENRKMTNAIETINNTDKLLKMLTAE